MKKGFFLVFAFFFVALACVTFSACGETEPQTVEEEIDGFTPLASSSEVVSANDYNYNYDNWYDFGKNNDVGIGYYNGSKTSISIGNKEQLARFVYICNENLGVGGDAKVEKWRQFNVYITADIDMSAMNWTPMGTSGNPYTGHFYGQGHYISGIKVTSEVNDAAGFFGYTSGVSSYVDDLAVEVKINVNNGILSDCYVGGLIGHSDYTFINNCAVRGSLSATGHGYIRMGGIVGQSDSSNNTQITNCVNYASVSCSVSGTIQAGIIGYAKKADIKGCLNLGSVNAYGDFYAGIAGKITSGSIKACSEYGNVTKNMSRIHGYDTTNVTVENCAYGDTTKGGKSYMNHNDSSWESLFIWTYACQDAGDFIAWSKSEQWIVVPKSILFSFNISFGWDSHNGTKSGYFSKEHNAMYAYYDDKTVYGTYGEKYKYEYVLGAKFRCGIVDIHTNGTGLFEYSDNSVDNTENDMFYSDTGFLYYKNALLMGAHSDKKITFHSKQATLTINATNCNGMQNGNQYTWTNSYYYRDDVTKNIYASTYYETPKLSGTPKNSEGEAVTYSNGYVRLYFTGAMTINLTATATEYTYNVKFVDRVNGKSLNEPKKFTYENYKQSVCDLGDADYSREGFGFTITVVDGSNVKRNPAGFKCEAANNRMYLNSNFSSCGLKNGITIYVNYGNVTENTKNYDIWYSFGVGEPSKGDDYFPMYDIEITDKLSGKYIDGKDINTLDKFRNALSSLVLDIDYTVSYQLVDDKFRLRVSDSNDYYASFYVDNMGDSDTVYMIEFRVYKGFLFDGDKKDESKFNYGLRLDDVLSEEKSNCRNFTVKFVGDVLYHNEINLVFTIDKFQIEFDKYLKGTTFLGTEESGIFLALFHHKIKVEIDSSKTSNNLKFVGIKCNGNIVTLGKTYEFVVNPQLYPAALDKNFKLLFEAVYVTEDGSIEAKEPDRTGNHYYISSVENLQWLANQVNSGNTFENCTFTQICDIDFTGKKFVSIGNESYAFKGVYDGGNYYISNINHGAENYNYDESGYVGLFGNVQNATIKNLTIKDSKFVGYRYVGAVVGKATNSTFYNLNVYNCEVKVTEFEFYDIYGKQTGTSKEVTYSDTITKVGNVISTIHTAERVGFAGVVGNAKSCTFTGVGFNLGSISNSGCSVGAFVGVAENSVTISQCYVDCMVNSVTNFVGNNAYFTATDYYFNNVKKVKTNSSNWMTLGSKEVLKFFYWAA